MRKTYDDFIQLKPKDMSKAISDMTFEFINPETQQPTVVPSSHFEKILSQFQEQYISDVVTTKMLSIIYDQLIALRKENEKYFQQALLCMDMGINPKDLRHDEQIAIEYTYDYMCEKQKLERKDYHFINQDIVYAFKEAKENRNLQAQVVKFSNELKNTKSTEERIKTSRDER